MAKRVDAGPIAEGLTRKMVAGIPDGRLVTLKDGRVRVLMGVIFPAGSGFKRTVEGRRRRLQEDLILRLATHRLGEHLQAGGRHSHARGRRVSIRSPADDRRWDE